MKRGPIPNHKQMAMTGNPKSSGCMAKGGAVKPPKTSSKGNPFKGGKMK